MCSKYKGINMNWLDFQAPKTKYIHAKVYVFCSRFNMYCHDSNKNFASHFVIICTGLQQKNAYESDFRKERRDREDVVGELEKTKERLERTKNKVKQKKYNVSKPFPSGLICF